MGREAEVKQIVVGGVKVQIPKQEAPQAMAFVELPPKEKAEPVDGKPVFVTREPDINLVREKVRIIPETFGGENLKDRTYRGYFTDGSGSKFASAISDIYIFYLHFSSFVQRLWAELSMWTTRTISKSTGHFSGTFRRGIANLFTLDFGGRRPGEGTLIPFLGGDRTEQDFHDHSKAVSSKIGDAS